MKNISVLFVTTLLLASSAFAINGSDLQCSYLIKECFAYKENAQRNNCFFSAGKHAFCEGTQLGKLSISRWSLSSGSTPQGAPALLGASVVDQQCLANCDNQWLGKLINGSIKNSDNKNIELCYEGCKRNMSLEILRP